MSNEFEFNIELENGTTIKAEKLFDFENNNIKYLVYTDNTRDENHDLNIYATRYHLDNDKLIFDLIEEEQEWDLIDNKIKEIVGD